MYVENGGRRDGSGGVGTGIVFTPAPDGGLEVFDPIERHQYVLGTTSAVAPTPVGTDRFLFPVSDAVEITTDAITLPTVTGVYVRNEAGETVAETEHLAYEEVPAGSYSVELTTPVKTYLRVEAAMLLTSGFDGTRIEFDGETSVQVGSRSRHEHPAATITTTGDPVDLMAAISTFGSALKTTSPERSYPTLRGHPPTIELGDELHVPAHLERPDTGVRIEVPTDHRSVYVVASLAYYLGAEVVPGSVPRIVTDVGFEHRLDSPRGFEDEVERVLKQTFFLDCLVRTEGYYKVDLHERRAIEADLELDFAALYDLSLGERLAAYLAVPYEAVADQIPEWKLTTHVAPEAQSAELLPFLVDDLAIIRSPKVQAATGSADQLAAVNDFLRTDDFTRSASESASPGPATLRPEQTDSMEQAWFGSGAPIGASKPTVEAFRNRLDRAPADGDIDITVVCNDPEMNEERDVVDTVYGSRTELPFDVSVHHELTRQELRALLAGETDFLHYIGHIDAHGFQCADGKLDAKTLETVGVDAFFLNACQSYEQGLALIQHGAIGGVVTLRDVINSGAVKIGATLSRLLNRGFPLRAGLTIASDQSVIGQQYVVVGDGGLAIAQAESGLPVLCEISTTGDPDEVEMTYRSFPTNHQGMGTLVMPMVESSSNYYLGLSRSNQHTVSREEVIEFLSLEDGPVVIDGKLHWADEFDPSVL